MAQQQDNALHFAECVLKEMQSFRVAQKFCDIHFTTEQQERSLGAHRVVLAASSLYLRKLFENERETAGEIRVKIADGEILEMLINFCYTGVMDVCGRNVEQLLIAATVLQLNGVVDICADFLRQQMAKTDSWYDVLQIAEKVKLQSLRGDALRYAVYNFMKVSRTKEFLDISAELLEMIIESDELNVPAEQEAFHAVQRWYAHDKAGRRQDLVKLIAALRITQLDVGIIFKQIRVMPGCGKMALDALDWIHTPINRSKTSLKHTNARQTYNDADNRNSSNWTLIAIPVAPKNTQPILQYDPERSQWHQSAKVSLKRFHFKVVYTHKSQLFFIGGRFSADNKICNFTGSYDFMTHSWRMLSPMRKCRVYMCVEQLKEYIYVIGGHDEQFQTLSSVERFNVNTGEWSNVNPMFTARYKAATVIYHGKIYVIGGVSETNGSLCSMECYDPQQDNWERLANMRELRCACGAAVAHNKIYVMGGWNTQHGELQTVECYDPLKNQWTQICSLLEKRKQVCGVFFNNRLMALGGVYVTGRSDAWKDVVEEYDFKRNAWQRRRAVPLKDEFDCVAIPTYFANVLRGITINGA